MEENVTRVDCMLCKMAVRDLDIHLQINHHKSISQIKQLKEVGTGFRGFGRFSSSNLPKKKRKSKKNYPGFGQQLLMKETEHLDSRKIKSPLESLLEEKPPVDSVLTQTDVQMELTKQNMDSYMKQLVSPLKEKQSRSVAQFVPIRVKFDHKNNDVTKIELEIKLEKDFQVLKVPRVESSPLFPKDVFSMTRPQEAGIRDKDKGVLRCSDCSEVIEYDVKFGKGKIEKLINKHRNMCGLMSRASQEPTYCMKPISNTSNELTTDEYYNHHYGATCRHTDETERSNCMEGLEICQKVVRRPRINEPEPPYEPEDFDDYYLDNQETETDEHDNDLNERVLDESKMVACEFCEDIYMEGEHAKLFHTLRRHHELYTKEETGQTNHLCPFCWSSFVPRNTRLTWNNVVEHLTYGKCSIRSCYKCRFCELEFTPKTVQILCNNKCANTVSEAVKRHLIKHKIKPHRWTSIATPIEYEKCDKCQKFIKATKLEKHLKEHSRPYRCEWCDSNVANLMNIWLHVECSHPDKDVSWQCYHCAANQDKVQAESSKNFERKRYRCSTCNKAFYQTSRLLTHEKNKLCARIDYCAICNKNFARARNAVSHMKKVHPNVPESRYFSEKLFNIVAKKNEEVSHQSMSLRPKKDFIKHVRKKHMKGVAKPETIIKVEEDGMTTYNHTCPLCPRDFKFVTEANRHVYHDHRDLIMSIPSEKHSYKCEMCKSTYESYAIMKQHWRRTHPSTRRKYICCLCDNEFMNIRKLTIHLQETMSDFEHSSSLEDLNLKQLILVKNNSKDKFGQSVDHKRGAYNKRKMSNVCFKCQKYCPKQKIKAHILGHFFKELNTVIPQDRPLICPDCKTGKVWGQGIALARHVAFKHKKIFDFATEEQLYGPAAVGDESDDDQQNEESLDSNDESIGVDTEAVASDEDVETIELSDDSDEDY